MGLVGSDQEIFKCHGSGRVWSGLVTGGFQISRVEPGLVGSGQELSKYHRSSRVWSGRVRRFPNITGRAGSGRVGSGGFQISRVGPGHPGLIRPAVRDPILEKL